MSAPNTPWTYEVQELSEGYSAIVYNERGLAIVDHLDEATARLIAAAPDMFDACGDALELLNADVITPDALNRVGQKLQAVIAKATQATGAEA